MKLIQAAKRMLGFFGIDAAVGFVLAGNIWIGVFSLIQLALIVRYLSPAEQGVNFSIAALFQIQLLFDLGFGIAIQQIASHQRAFLHETVGGTLGGDLFHLQQLAAILRLTFRWHLGVALAWTAIMLPAGWLFFSHINELQGIDWQLPWVLTVIAAAGGLATIGFSRFLSGCGDVTAVARVTTLQLMISSTGFCIAMALGAKLLAFPIGMLLGLTVLFVWLLFIRRPLLVHLFRTQSPKVTLNWRRDVAQFQWRIAVWLFSTQAFQAMNPVAMASFG